MSFFVVLKTLSQLATPVGLMVCGLAVGGVLVLMRLRRLGRAIGTFAIAQMVLFCFMPVGDALMMPLEDRARAAAAAASPCCYQFIVVLGAGVTTAAPPLRPEAELTDSSDRLWYAARLYRRGLAPRIVVSGGSFGELGGAVQSEAEAMRQVLVDFGVPEESITLEARSLNTIDNIRNVRTLVGAQRVALVTSGYHMPRALRLARLAHLDAEAFPTDWQIVPYARPTWARFLPSVDALWYSTLALREWMALAFDRRGESAFGAQD